MREEIIVRRINQIADWIFFVLVLDYSTVLDSQLSISNTSQLNQTDIAHFFKNFLAVNDMLLRLAIPAIVLLEVELRENEI